MARMNEQVHIGVPVGPFLSLYERTYGKAMPPDVFDWKYVGHPHGQPVVWTVSAAGGSWVGAMVLQPRRYRDGEHTLLAGQLVDLMVDPAHRRRGIFSAIVHRIVAEHRQHGFHLVFTIPATGGMSIGGFRSVPFLRKVGALRSYRRLWRARSQEGRRLRSDRLAAAVGPLVRLWLASRDRLRAEPLPVRMGEPFDFRRDGLVTDEEWVRWRLRSSGRTMESLLVRDTCTAEWRGCSGDGEPSAQPRRYWGSANSVSPSPCQMFHGALARWTASGATRYVKRGEMPVSRKPCLIRQRRMVGDVEKVLIHEAFLWRNSAMHVCNRASCAS